MGTILQSSIIGKSMKVIIESTETSERSGVSANGRPWTLRSQSARVQSEFLAGPIELTVPDGQPAYVAGEYDLNLEKSIAITQYGQLQMLRRLHLKLIKANPMNSARVA